MSSAGIESLSNVKLLFKIKSFLYNLVQTRLYRSLSHYLNIPLDLSSLISAVHFFSIFLSIVLEALI